MPLLAQQYCHMQPTYPWTPGSVSIGAIDEEEVLFFVPSSKPFRAMPEAHGPTSSCGPEAVTGTVEETWGLNKTQIKSYITMDSC